MDDKTLQFLTAMASKLGTTAEHLWAVMIRQAQVSAFTSIVVLAGFTVLLAFCTVLLVRHERKRREEYESAANWAKPHDPRLAQTMTRIHLVADEDFEILNRAGLYLVAAWVILILAVAVEANSIVTAFANPEYWALTKILSQLKG